jgi:Asp-tRNA(Asn)/Glu-tRNA(Gln) amidotransferase A subunit family amidase
MRKLLLFILLAAGSLAAFTFYSPNTIDPAAIAGAETVIGLEFTPAQRDSMLDNLNEQRKGYELVRKHTIPNSLAPALTFDPRIGVEGKVNFPEKDGARANFKLPALVKVPKNRQELAFYTISQLAYLLKNKKITSEELTRLSLERLKKYNPQLQCVITLTEERAMESARRADKEIKTGKWRGLLHGIPYGAKDLLAVEGYPTTWGAMAYKDQELKETATVIKKLDEAGAILVAKLSLGALAWGDVWFNGTTKNPWNLEQGSSGSSAGPASAVAAGLVPFAIGSETWGSIVSPSTRTGITGLRPTFGTVSRSGAMALSWTMDKLGPMARCAEDCAIVYDAIRGYDATDPYSIASRYTPNDKPLKELKIGYLQADFEADDYWARSRDSVVLAKFRALGAKLEPVYLPTDNELPIEGLPAILSAEAAAAFDDLTRSQRDTLLVRQIKNAWPNVFRSARFIPAVEYLQANRVRLELMKEVNRRFKDYDVIIAPTFSGNQLLITNLTGHPCLVMPSGLNQNGNPANVSICLLGNLFDEGKLVNVARQYQQATDWEERKPGNFLE